MYKKAKQITPVKILFIFLGVLSSTLALAGSGGDQFIDIWVEISEWLKGTPGKILALLAFGFAFLNVMRQNFIMAIGALVGCMLMANGVSIIESFLNAGI